MGIITCSSEFAHIATAGDGKRAHRMYNVEACGKQSRERQRIGQRLAYDITYFIRRRCDPTRGRGGAGRPSFHIARTCRSSIQLAPRLVNRAREPAYEVPRKQDTQHGCRDQDESRNKNDVASDQHRQGEEGK